MAKIEYLGDVAEDKLLIALLVGRFDQGNDRVIVYHTTREEATVPTGDLVRRQVVLPDTRRVRIDHISPQHKGDAVTIMVRAEAPSPAAAPVINALFETTTGGWTGTANAPIKRIERQDDGSFTVVIDHWPAPAGELIKPGLTYTLRTALERIQAHDQKLDDPNGDGSGNCAESPIGDDYNDVCALLQPLYDILGMTGPFSPDEPTGRQEG